MRNKKDNSEVKYSSFLAKGVSIRGDIKAEEGIRLEGELEGNLKCSAKVIIGEGGRLIGDVHANDVEVEGVVQGDIFVKGIITLKTGAEVHGSLYTEKLIIENGALFNGHSEMHENRVDFFSIGENQPIALNA